MIGKRFGNTEFGLWLYENNAYEYYAAKLEKQMKIFDIGYEDNKASVSYLGYKIMVLEVRAGSIFLINDEGNKEKTSFVQKKLEHEYCEMFNIYKDEYKITQYNIFLLHRYIEKVREKIEYGFEKYTNLFDKNKLVNTNLGFLKIGIHNSFSVAELNELIDAYNRLYSIIYCICQYGYEEVSQMELDEAEKSQSMILESINIGSSGFFISVASQVVAAAIVAVAKALIANDQDAYNNSKQKLKEIAYEESPEVGARVENLIQRWDNLVRLRENKRVPGHVIDREISNIADEIARLQGTQHIDMLV